MKRYAILLAMKTALVLLVLTLAMAVYGQPAQATLVNGSFEDTTNFVPDGRDTMILNSGSTAMTGWTVIGNQIGWIGPSNPFGLTASQGSYFLDLTGDHTGSPFGGVEQTITLSAGQYKLEFDLGSSTTYGLPSALTATAGLTSQTFTSTNSSSSDAWEHCVMLFSGSGSTTISLMGYQGRDYIGLDNVTVSAIPLPPTALLLGSGLLGLGLLRFRKRA